MSIDIGWFSFDGPFNSAEKLRDEAGVFVILNEYDSNEWEIIDVDNSDKVQSAVKEHERRQNWEDSCGGKPAFAAIYPDGSSEADRRSITTEIRIQYEIVHGEKINTKSFGPPKPFKNG